MVLKKKISIKPKNSNKNLYFFTCTNYLKKNRKTNKKLNSNLLLMIYLFISYLKIQKYVALVLTMKVKLIFLGLFFFKEYY